MRLCPLTTAMLSVLMASIGLTGCDEGPNTVSRFVRAEGSWDFLVDATRNGEPLYLDIAGSPYSEADSLFAERVAGVIDGGLQARPFTVTTSPGSGEAPGYRIIFAFNAPGLTNVDDRCHAEAAGGGPQPDGKVELLASFCEGERVLAAVDGWVERTESSSDERFAGLIHQTLRELFVKPRPDH